MLLSLMKILLVNIIVTIMSPGIIISICMIIAARPGRHRNSLENIQTENFRNQPLGINGNEDCGQMAAWYIFGVMGFYPVASASGMYAIGAPQFPKLTLNYAVEGKARSLEITANNLSDANKYIQKVSLDGKQILTPFISHSDIISGTKLVFEMGAAPNKDFK